MQVPTDGRLAEAGDEGRLSQQGPQMAGVRDWRNEGSGGTPGEEVQGQDRRSIWLELE